MDRIKVERLAPEEAEKRGVGSWGVWEKEPSDFDWEYTSEEHCYIIEGKARISTAGGDIDIEQGDYVVFPVGLKCRWNVERSIKKYYEFR